MSSPTERRGMSRWLKAVIFLVVFALVVVVLFTTVFPWLDRNVLNDPTLEASMIRLDV